MANLYGFVDGSYPNNKVSQRHLVSLGVICEGASTKWPVFGIVGSLSPSIKSMGSKEFGDGR
jgi:hypothetical protein